jgi:hypothetical protein
MPRLKQRLQFAAGLLVALGWIPLSCSQRDAGPLRETPAEPVVDADTAAARVVPRRTQPLVITNRVVVEEVRPAVAAATNNTAPVVTCATPQLPPCSSAEGTPITLSAHVEDVDGNALSVIWNIDGRDRYTQQVAAGGPPTAAEATYSYTMTPGDHAIKVTVLDGSLSASCDLAISLRGDTQEPVVTCPRDVSASVDPGRCTAVVTFAPKAADNCPDVAAACEPPSGSAFPVGLTTVTCTATDTAGNVAECSFNVAVQVINRCPRNEGYWRQNPGAWPVSTVQLGGHAYNRTQLSPLLRATVSSDASMVLARQLIVAALNTAAGSDPRPVCGDLEQANAVLSGFSGKLPYRISLSSAVGRSMVNLSTRLNGYNSGIMTPNCVP